MHPRRSSASALLGLLFTAGCFNSGDGPGSEGGTSSGASTGSATEVAPTSTSGEPTSEFTTTSGTTPGTTPGTDPGTDPGTTPGTTEDPTTAGTLTDTSATDPSGTTDAPATCDEQPACIGAESCAQCSLADTCAQALGDCLATPNDECNKYSNCVSSCNSDPECINACHVAFPGGYDPSWALFDCAVCTACPNACASGQAYCANGGGGPGKTGETCDDIGDCTLCNACSAGKDCATEVADCEADPECKPYQTCIQACPQNDMACLDACAEQYPSGYDHSWAQFDCAVCDACPASCPTAATYCEAGGGGPGGGEERGPECASNADCKALYENDYPFCIEQYCAECTGNQHCGDPNAPTCIDNYCE